ncbi:MFS transporter [Pantoea sp. AG1095]|nr:MFS transporter [Pantoea sp. AG1095]
MLKANHRPQNSHVRVGILCLILFLSVVAYADRSILSISGSAIKDEFGLSAIQLGLILSAFSWAYVIGQIPGGLFLDRFGTKKVYGVTLALWSISTLLMGFVGEFSSGMTMALTLMFALRFALGLIEAPSFPANARAVIMWFPSAERGVLLHSLPRRNILPSPSFRRFPAGWCRASAGNGRSLCWAALAYWQCLSGWALCAARAIIRRSRKMNCATLSRAARWLISIRHKR